MGYIPPKQLSPREILATLRTLNSLITIRLTTQENVPPQLTDWTVKSGRATFRVRDEFELDLSIADENPSSQFYFIDFRLSFRPVARKLAAGNLRNAIEWKVNDILRREGLLACYEYLHELVLEHNLTILRDQARQMIKTNWAGDAFLRASSRGLVLQYWVNRPGKKNWVEIGVNSGRSKRTERWSQPATSHLSFRWHRHGVEVRDHGMEIDTAHLSMEKMLKEVIARHTNHTFKETKKRLKTAKIRTDAHLTVKHRAHAFDPQQCSLKVQISTRQTISIQQDYVTGRFVTDPPTFCEQQMNGMPDPAATSALALEVLRCDHALERTQLSARPMGWKLNRMYTANRYTMRQLFGSEELRYQFYTIPNWPLNFILAVTTSMNGDKVWLVEIQEVPKELTPDDWAAGVYQPLRQALEIKIIDQPVVVIEPDKRDLKEIEKLGSLMIAQLMDCRSLHSRRAVHDQKPSAQSHGIRQIPELFVQFPMPQAKGEPPRPTVDNSWCHEILKVNYPGVSRSRKEVYTVAVGKLRNPRPDIQTLTGSVDSSLAFHPTNGNFAFSMRTPLGHCSIAATEEKLYRLAALIKFLDTASRYSLICTQISLTSMTFNYSAIPPSIAAPISIGQITAEQLTATISIPPDEKMRISFAKGNPHLYTADFLTRELQAPNGLDAVAATLRTTLPTLSAISKIDAAHTARSSAPTFDFLPRSATCFIARYSNKTVFLEFEIRLRERRETVLWLTLAKFGKRDSRKPPGKLDGTAKLSSSVNDSSKISGKGTQTNQVNTASNKKEPKSTSTTKNDSRSNNLQDPAREIVPKPGNLALSTLSETWKSLTHERGAGWNGVGNGICVQLSSAGPCLYRIDERLTEVFAKATDDPPPAPGEKQTSTESKTQAQPSGEKEKPSPKAKPKESPKNKKAQPAPKPTANTAGLSKNASPPAARGGPATGKSPQTPSLLGLSTSNPGVPPQARPPPSQQPKTGGAAVANMGSNSKTPSAPSPRPGGGPAPKPNAAAGPKSKASPNINIPGLPQNLPQGQKRTAEMMTGSPSHALSQGQTRAPVAGIAPMATMGMAMGRTIGGGPGQPGQPVQQGNNMGSVKKRKGNNTAGGGQGGGNRGGNSGGANRGGGSGGGGREVITLD